MYGLKKGKKYICCIYFINLIILLAKAMGLETMNVEISCGRLMVHLT